MTEYEITFLGSIHCSMGSASVGTQCPLTSSLDEFLGYWDWLWYPVLSPVLVSIALPYLGVFYSLFFTSHGISFVYISRWRYLHPTTNPPPYSRLGTGTIVTGYPKRLRYHGGEVLHSGPWGRVITQYTRLEMHCTHGRSYGVSGFNPLSESISVITRSIYCATPLMLMC